MNIYPEPGNLKKIAVRLLELADRPQDVEYIMWPEQGFRVPVDLGDRFVAEWVQETDSGPGHEESVKITVPAAPEVAKSEEPVRRKPGRPKRNQEGQ